jgi:hypothetical protein
VWAHIGIDAGSEKSNLLADNNGQQDPLPAPLLSSDQRSGSDQEPLKPRTNVSCRFFYMSIFNQYVVFCHCIPLKQNGDNSTHENFRVFFNVFYHMAES